MKAFPQPSIRARPATNQPRKNPVIRSLACMLVVVAFSAGAARGQAAQAGPPRTFLVSTAPGVSLEVMDWGGTGRPLVFLAGGGHSAREFAEFAPPLVASYRVLGISRRGSGTSSDVPPDSLGQLVDDVAAVLDSLHLQSAVPVGHSFGGMEMARFGKTHPDRCAGLVYLDAAYDYTDPEIGRVMTEAPPPAPPAMTAADSAISDRECGLAYEDRVLRRDDLPAAS
jgi:non-heme chloroperoxidase